MMILSCNKSLDSFCEFAPRLYVVILLCRMFPWLLSVICVLRNGSGVHTVKRIVSLHCDLSCCVTRITAVRHTQFVVCMRHVQSWRHIYSYFVLNYLGLLCSLSSVDSIRWSGFPVQINPVEFVSFYECLIVCMYVHACGDANCSSNKVHLPVKIKCYCCCTKAVFTARCCASAPM